MTFEPYKDTETLGESSLAFVVENLSASQI